jgi:hypothetical protein
VFSVRAKKNGGGTISCSPPLRRSGCTAPDSPWGKRTGINLVEGNVESWGDDSALVESAVELDDDLASSVIIDNFEFTNVAVLHHDLEELDDDLRGGSDENLSFRFSRCTKFNQDDYLSLSSLLSVADVLESVGQNVHANHGDFFVSGF